MGKSPLLLVEHNLKFNLVDGLRFWDVLACFMLSITRRHANIHSLIPNALYYLPPSFLITIIIKTHSRVGTNRQQIGRWENERWTLRNKVCVCREKEKGLKENECSRLTTPLKPKISFMQCKNKLCFVISLLFSFSFFCTRLDNFIQKSGLQMLRKSNWFLN